MTKIQIYRYLFMLSGLLMLAWNYFVRLRNDRSLPDAT